MRPFFKDDTFNFLTEVALGVTFHKAADVGEVLSTVERIRNGRARSWVDEWTATADRLAGEGDVNAEAGLQQRQRRGGDRCLVQGIADALERGWNAATFDGPGQNAALVRQHLPFRPDWEKVITPVVDYLLTRPDVDAGKVALVGVSQAGYWVPRSVAFEHRIAAAVADPGVIDISTTMTAQVPHFLLKMMEAGEKDKFDKDMG